MYVVKNSIRLLLLTLLTCSQALLAGEISLKNGDQLQGELMRLDGSLVIWQSESFGELAIPKASVADLQTGARMKINGHSAPCTIGGMQGPDLYYNCADGGVGSVPLLTLEVALPYADHVAGAHTYKGRLSVAGVTSRGNKVENNWDLDSDVVFRRGDFRHAMLADYEARSQDSLPSDERFKVAYGLDWFFNTRWFWYNQLTVGGDETKRIDERYTFGSGLGYQVWESERTALALKGGITYVKELYDRPLTPVLNFENSDERAVWAMNIDYRYQLPRGIALFHMSDVSQSFESSGDWLLTTDTGLSVPLGAGLFSEFKFEYDVDNEPQPGTRREDARFSVGVGYSW